MQRVVDRQKILKEVLLGMAILRKGEGQYDEARIMGREKGGGSGGEDQSEVGDRKNTGLRLLMSPEKSFKGRWDRRDARGTPIQEFCKRPLLTGLESAGEDINGRDPLEGKWGSRWCRK